MTLLKQLEAEVQIALNDIATELRCDPDQIGTGTVRALENLALRVWQRAMASERETIPDGELTPVVDYADLSRKKWP